MDHTWTCGCCGEINELPCFDPANALKSVCWECGIARVVIFAMPVAKKSDEEKQAEVDAAAKTKAEKLIPVLASKLTLGKFKAHELIKSTCIANRGTFAKHFTAMIVADERFADVVAIMSPAQRDGRW